MDWLLVLVGIALGVIGLLLYLKLNKFMKRNEKETVSKVEKKLIRNILYICLCEVVAVVLIMVGVIK